MPYRIKITMHARKAEQSLVNPDCWSPAFEGRSGYYSGDHPWTEVDKKDAEVFEDFRKALKVANYMRKTIQYDQADVELVD